jgi:hypothetical protein
LGDEAGLTMIIYETGQTVDQHDVLAKANIFLTNNGWTVDYYGADGTDGYRLHVHNGSFYFVLKSTNLNPSTDYTQHTAKHIYVCGATGYASGSAWNAQPGSSASMGCPIVRDCGGPHVAYHFFLDNVAQTFFCTIEITAGVFRHFGFGAAALQGVVSGSGAFVVADFHYAGGDVTNNYHSPMAGVPGYSVSVSSYQGAIRLDVDSATGVWQPISSNTSLNPRVVGSNSYGGWFQHFYQITPNSFNTAHLVVPTWLWAYRPAYSLWSLIGTIPNLGAINIADLDPSSDLVVGAITWKVFPMLQKGSTESANYGYAIRKA